MDYFSKGDWVTDKQAGLFQVVSRHGTKTDSGEIEDVFYKDKYGTEHQHATCLLASSREAEIYLITTVATLAASKGCLQTLQELGEMKKELDPTVVKEAWHSLPTDVKAKIHDMSKVAVAR